MRSNRRNGFTLIELVLVIVILGLLSVVVVPKYVDMQKDAELATAQRFGAALKEACNGYLSRAVVTGGMPANIDFSTFVTLSGSPLPQHTLEVEGALRDLLQDPAAPIAGPSDGYTRIRLVFRSGARATYTIVPATGQITDTYTGFAAGGGGGGCQP